MDSLLEAVQANCKFPITLEGIMQCSLVGLFTRNWRVLKPFTVKDLPRLPLLASNFFLIEVHSYNIKLTILKYTKP